MSRHLLIMRHAQAEEIQHEQTDRNRELTSRGQQEALQVAAQLAKRSISIDAIFASIAIRTQQTAAFVSDVLKLNAESLYVEEDLYNSSIRTYLSFVSSIDSRKNNILLIGHNPTVTYLAEYLTNEEIGTIPTAGICIVKLENDSWKNTDKGKATLVEFIKPSELI